MFGYSILWKLVFSISTLSQSDVSFALRLSSSSHSGWMRHKGMLCQYSMHPTAVFEWGTRFTITIDRASATHCPWLPLRGRIAPSRQHRIRDRDQAVVQSSPARSGEVTGLTNRSLHFSRRIPSLSFSSAASFLSDSFE